MKYSDLAREIFALDVGIRFVGIAIMEGKIIAAEYKHGIVPLLNRKESELSFMQALIRMNTRRTLEQKVGRPLFSLTEYERIIRTTIMVYDAGNRLKLGKEFVLLVSFEKTVNPYSIIKDKIIPFIDKKIEINFR
jgi:hypothetical protein